MTSLQRYHSANLPELMKIISKHGIGMDDYLDRFFNSFETTTNYPPYNLIHVNNVESVLEIALAGFGKKNLRFTLNMENSLSKGRKKLIKRHHPSMSIKDWLKEVSQESGHFQKILKSERFNSKMDFLPSSWVR